MNLIEIETTEAKTAEAAYTDWSVLEIPGAMDAANWAAVRAAREFDGLQEADPDDLRQEAYILLARRPGEVRRLYAEEANPGGILQQRLYRDLFDKLRPRSKRLTREESYDARVAGDA